MGPMTKDTSFRNSTNTLIKAEWGLIFAQLCRCEHFSQITVKLRMF